MCWGHMTECLPGGGDGGGLSHDGEVRLRGRRNHAGHQHHEWRGTDHDRTRQHHARVRPGHHGHQQWWWWRWGRPGIHEEWAHAHIMLIQLWGEKGTHVLTLLSWNHKFTSNFPVGASKAEWRLEPTAECGCYELFLSVVLLSAYGRNRIPTKETR